VRRAMATLVVLGLVLLVPPSASARSCSSVVNPYPGTRYEGVDLSSIQAKGVACSVAQKVAKGAHRKALGLSPEAVRRFQWKGWQVVGDLRPPSDKYVATRGGKQVRWRF
jgi:hypothetical protein